MGFDRLQQLVERVSHGYPLWQVAIELVVIWLVVYGVVRLVQGTRAAGAMKSIFFIVVVGTLLVRILGQREAFQRLVFLYDNVVAVIAVALIVIFQPELRRGLTRMGEASLFRRAPKPETEVVDAVVEACRYLSRAKFGALMVIEGRVSLKGVAEGGTLIGAKVTPRLLQTIFFPGSALHDLAVIIGDDQIKAAGVQLPLAEVGDLEDPTLGSRHRAAVGLSQDTDAVVVVVSEETGTISLAERGQLTRGLSEEELRGLLVLKLNRGLVRQITNMPAEEAHDGLVNIEDLPHADDAHDGGGEDGGDGRMIVSGNEDAHEQSAAGGQGAHS